MRRHSAAAEQAFPGAAWPQAQLPVQRRHQLWQVVKGLQGCPAPGPQRIVLRCTAESARLELWSQQGQRAQHSLGHVAWRRSDAEGGTGPKELPTLPLDAAAATLRPMSATRHAIVAPAPSMQVGSVPQRCRRKSHCTRHMAVQLRPALMPRVNNTHVLHSGSCAASHTAHASPRIVCPP